MAVFAANRGSIVVGREAELSALDRFLGGAEFARSLVVAGPAGIGKTRVWEAGIGAARERGFRVLAARPAAPEAGLSFAGLADLLEPIDDELLRVLPAPQRRALEVALLRAEPGPAPVGVRAVAAGLVAVVRGLTVRSPVLVAVDDVQWLDAASVGPLAFAARRLAGEPVCFLLARRGDEVSVLEGAFAPGERAGLELGGLSFGALRSLLAEAGLSRMLLRRLFETSAGNPLFALELARLLREQGVVDADGELPVPALVEEVAGERVGRLSPGQRRLLLAVALSPSLTRAQLASVGEVGTVAELVAAGVLVVDGERVRAAHPLFAAAVRSRASERERRAVHRALAAVVDDLELRARHLAHASEGADAGLAALVVAASAHAAARGAAAEAAELAAQAYRLTPPRSTERPERLCVLAERLTVAGEPERVRALLTGELDLLPAGAARARARLLLAESEFLLVHVSESGALLAQALAESEGEAAVHARAAAAWSRYLTVALVERLEEAERCASDALPEARRAGPSAEREVLQALALARKLRGRPIDDLCAHFEAVSDDAFHLRDGVERIAADRLGSHGQIGKARQAFRRLLALADERGEAWSSMWLLHQLCELELRAGELDAAEALLDEWAESPDRSLLDELGYARCRALLAAARGRPAEVAEWADPVVDECAARGLAWNLLEATRARGLAALLAHETAPAAESLGRVWAHCQRQGVDEPAEFPVAADLVEALVELDRLDEAGAVTGRLRTLAEAQQHPWALATATRCEALIALAKPGEQPFERLAEAAAAYERLGLRFDHARTLLAAGRAARRRRKWKLAAELLERALAAFAAIGADGWAGEARDELARIGGRKAATNGELTVSERRVAELAANGLSNREIAATLVISPATVATHLTRARAKLGVHSRAQLATRL